MMNIIQNVQFFSRRYLKSYIEANEQLNMPGNLEDAFLKVQYEQENLNIDEVLTDYNWEVGGDSSALETRLVNELMALEAVTIHDSNSLLIHDS
jgi:hypothetical protein